MTTPVVSLIIPVYNAEHYIERCINQLIHQTFDHIEIIMIDDGSTDNSGVLCDVFIQRDSRCKCIHKKNEGVSKARNDGIEISKGQYICFIDVDDLVSLDYVEMLYNAIKKDKTDICICDFYEVKADENKLLHYNKHTGNSILIDTKKKYNSNDKYSHKTVWAAMFSRDIIGNCRFKEDFFVAEDSIFYYELLLKTSCISYIAEPMYTYIIYNQSASHGEFDEKKYSEIKALNVIRELYKNKNKYVRNSIDVWYCTICAKQLRMIRRSDVSNVQIISYLKKEGREHLGKLLVSNLSLKTKTLCFLSIYFSVIFKIIK